MHLMNQQNFGTFINNRLKQFFTSCVLLIINKQKYEFPMNKQIFQFWKKQQPVSRRSVRWRASAAAGNRGWRRPLQQRGGRRPLQLNLLVFNL